MEVRLLIFLPEYQCIYNVSARESENRNTRGKLATEMALKLEKSVESAHRYTYMLQRERCYLILLFGLIYFFILLVGWYVHFSLLTSEHPL